jgi:hypothetical protein
MRAETQAKQSLLRVVMGLKKAVTKSHDSDASYFFRAKTRYTTRLLRSSTFNFAPERNMIDSSHASNSR